MHKTPAGQKGQEKRFTGYTKDCLGTWPPWADNMYKLFTSRCWQLLQGNIYLGARFMLFGTVWV